MTRTEACGCGNPCPCGDACKCGEKSTAATVTPEKSTGLAGATETSSSHTSFCGCGEKCECNPCSCSKVNASGEAFCKCGSNCQCGTACSCPKPAFTTA